MFASPTTGVCCTALALLLSQTDGCAQVAVATAEAASSAGAAVVERCVGAMGTSLRLTVLAASRAEGLIASEAAVRAVAEVERRLSTWRDDSELAALNQAAVGVAWPISAGLRVDLQRAQKWAAATAGAFDPAIGSLLEAYGLRSGGRWPTAAAQRSARAAAGLRHLQLDGEAAVRRHHGMWLDAGAFGKGAALDAAGAAVLAAGASSARFDFGGQLHCVGADCAASFGVADPRDRVRAVVQLRIARGSLATTGNGQRGLIVDGRPLGHVLDPRTGLPAADFGSVTVWAENAFAADCLSTALFVMGPDDAIAWVAGQPGIEALVVRSDGSRLTVRVTPGLRGRVDSLLPGMTIHDP